MRLMDFLSISVIAHSGFEICFLHAPGHADINSLISDFSPNCVVNSEGNSEMKLKKRS